MGADDDALAEACIAAHDCVRLHADTCAEFGGCIHCSASMHPCCFNRGGMQHCRRPREVRVRIGAYNARQRRCVPMCRRKDHGARPRFLEVMQETVLGKKCKGMAISTLKRADPFNSGSRIACNLAAQRTRNFTKTERSHDAPHRGA